MAFIPVPDTAKATLQWSIFGQIVEITLHFLLTGGWDADSLSDLSYDLLNWAVNEMLPLLSNSAVLTNINCTDQTTDSAPSIDHPVSTANTGGNGSTPAPLNSTAAVKFLTDQRGRSYRGRNYWPILINNTLSNPVTIGAGEMAAMVAAYALLPSYLDLSGSTHVVASRYHDNAPRAVGVATPVTSYAMDQSVDSQRRRLAGRGI